MRGRFRLVQSLGVLLGVMVFVAAGSAVSAAKEKAEKAEKADKAEKKADKGKGKGKAIEKASYGTVDGKPVDIYTLTNSKGAIAKITNYGAIVTELHMPDKAGKMGDIVLGFDKVDDYVAKSPYFGAIVGRVANRIANGKFTLDGKQVQLNTNNAPHHLHGGKKGWDKVIWKAEPKETKDGPSLKLTHVSPDGEENYPGTVTATATYTLTNDNELRIDMSATTDKTTLINMAHHSYWNLAGGGTILEQELTIPADSYTPGTPMVPDGTIKPVKGTPFDFTKAKPIGKDLKAAGGTPVGFDHNWVVNGDPHAMRLMAKLKDPKSGRVMTITADQPGLQFYSGNFLNGSIVGKGGTPYLKNCACCFETQHFPDSPNQPAFPTTVLKQGQQFQQRTTFKFSVE